MKNNEENISGLVNTNERFRLINQLCERQLRRLTEENQGLRERVRALTTESDEHRLKLLLADRERRRLVKWKAIANKTIHFLKNSVQEFEEFTSEIEKGIAEMEKKGAIRTDFECAVPRRKTLEIAGNLTRIVESPLLLNSTLLGNGPKSAAGNDGDLQSVKATTAADVVDLEHTKEVEPVTNVTYVVQQEDKDVTENHNDTEFAMHGMEVGVDDPIERNSIRDKDKEMPEISNPTVTQYQTGEVFCSSPALNNIVHTNDISVSSFHGKGAPLFTSTPKGHLVASRDVVNELHNTPVSSTLRYARRSHIPIFNKKGVSKRRESFRIDFINCSDIRDQLAASVHTPKERKLTPRPECKETKIPTPRPTKKKAAKNTVAKLNYEVETEALNDDGLNKIRTQPTRSCKRTSTMSFADSVTNTKKTRSKRK